ncbi:MAG: hypothetical protein F6K19_13225 [Cyanothece sp. SIO1E1]|nr:hypothetical protein [Cyanothece sp. SIO1E1]
MPRIPRVKVNAYDTEGIRIGNGSLSPLEIAVNSFIPTDSGLVLKILRICSNDDQDDDAVLDIYCEEH